MGMSSAMSLMDMVTWQNFVACLIGVIFGLIIGATPGLTVSLGTILVLPLTYVMPMPTAIAFLMGIYAAGMCGGAFSAILINIPGTPAASATGIDGFPLAERGQGLKAIQMAVVASFFGGVFSMLVLMFSAPQIAKISLKLGAAELASLVFMGLTYITMFSEKSLIKGVISGVLGLMLVTVGMDPITGFNRYTLGIQQLSSGFDFLPAMIGLFAFPEIVKSVAESGKVQKIKDAVIKEAKGSNLKLRELMSSWKATLGGSVIGTIIGAIPGASAPVAVFMGYSFAKKVSREPEKFGNGSLEGVAAPQSASNAVSGGALIPLLTLGIPGDTVTAVLLGALMIQGLAPGPLLIRENPEVIYAVYAALIIANVLTLVVALSLGRFSTYIKNVPKHILIPVIALCCVVGSYSLRSSMFDVWVMVFFGILGYVMIRNGFSIIPLLLALVLGGNFETYFRQALIISNGDASVFVTRPISLTFLLIALLPIVFKMVTYFINKGKARAKDLQG